MPQTLKQRLINKEPLVGTFVKTPSPIICEVLSQTKLDLICLDAEHAPFDRNSLDTCIAVTRLSKMSSLVRVPSANPEHLLNALDCGATGVLVPHVKSAHQADLIGQHCHFGAGGRGYAGSTRAANFGGKSIPAHVDDSAKETTVIAQIEDLEALDEIDEIAQVSNIDCLFVGRIDLTVALGADSPADARVVAAVDTICQSAL
ncbi:MAG: aldolase/citrate lyase family protein, partial [Pseudomonadota bacterium]